MKRRCWVVFYEENMRPLPSWGRRVMVFKTKVDALHWSSSRRSLIGHFRNISKPIKVEEPCAK